ncbi:hypothetical protein ACFOLJ_25140 [Rugamonas sp. CCM 8940]|uniref:hypothetical protein n=1 Tax=Rugamonas sp. CCM 8940 TaxID=2765359 RepID=UPI0018F3E1E7|nr:hypothetical protein [Rugamonas sp. CCM 8940]MBJ7310847.1 hypothetical protein [Rugamonas sp. CCM 8940]
MHAPDQPQWRTYVTIFCAGSALVVGAVMALNYVVDPYLTHQWDTPQVQRLRPTREKLSAWGKTYAVAKFKPAVVYLGNSRTEMGLPTRVAMFAGKDVFNSALSGASIGDAIALAQHARRVSRLDVVVWGIDPPSFSMAQGNNDLDRELIAGGPHYLWRRGLLNLRRALAIDMTQDSIRLLRGAFGAVCHSSLAFHGQRDDACVDLRIGGWSGTEAAILPRTREYIRGPGPTAEAFSAFEASVDALCGDGAKVRLYINPTHAMMLDALYWAGKWAPLEAWQRGLAALAQRQRGRGCDVRVYDFSGYNSITTETVPQVSQRNKMEHYWETSHYRSNVGRMILGRIFGATEAAPPDDFGVELLPAAMDGHLALLHEGRERYHREHMVETALARAVAAEQGGVER